MPSPYSIKLIAEWTPRKLGKRLEPGTYRVPKDLPHEFAELAIKRGIAAKTKK